MTDWEYIGAFADNCHHLWKEEPRGTWDRWAYITDEGYEGDDPILGTLEFRQCVMCDSKQVREPPS